MVTTNVNQYLRPDGDNFLLIKTAWKMRLEGKQLDEIAQYLNNSYYSRQTSVGGKPMSHTKLTLSEYQKFFETLFVDFLQEHKFNTREVYDHYVVEMKRVIAEKAQIFETQRRTLVKAKVDTEDKIEKVKDLLLHETDIQVKDTFRADLKKEQANIITMSGDLDKLNKEKEKHKQATLSYEQFLKLFDDLPDIISKTKSLKEKDYLLEKST